jgi:hypothetical protein
LYESASSVEQTKEDRMHNVASILGAALLLSAACAHRARPAPTQVASESRPARETQPEEIGKLEVASIPTETRAEQPSQGQGLTYDALPPPSQGAPQRTAGSARGEEPASAQAAAPASLDKREAELRERIQRALLQSKELSYTAQRVRLEIAASDVTLRGEVRTAREKREVEELIQRVSGVRRVNNALAVIDQAPATDQPTTLTK